MKPEILTHSGERIDLLNPDPATIKIEDIAHGLSNVCRFGGQCDPFYSVAQHSVYVSSLVPKGKNNIIALSALLHDGSEAYIGDVTSPLKQLLPDYKVIESRLQKIIFRAFGLPEVHIPGVKEIDLNQLVTEGLSLMRSHPEDVWLSQAEPTQLPIGSAWSQNHAKQIFLQVFRELTA